MPFFIMRSLKYHDRAKKSVSGTKYSSKTLTRQKQKFIDHGYVLFLYIHNSDKSVLNIMGSLSILACPIIKFQFFPSFGLHLAAFFHTLTEQTVRLVFESPNKLYICRHFKYCIYDKDVYSEHTDCLNSFITKHFIAEFSMG